MSDKNPTTRRYSRTLSEAFGPHTSRQIWTEPEPIHPHDVLVMASCCIALVVLFVVMVMA